MKVKYGMTGGGVTARGKSLKALSLMTVKTAQWSGLMLLFAYL